MIKDFKGWKEVNAKRHPNFPKDIASWSLGLED
jgi:hypothetical protein